VTALALRGDLYHWPTDLHLVSTLHCVDEESWSIVSNENCATMIEAGTALSLRRDQKQLPNSPIDYSDCDYHSDRPYRSECQHNVHGEFGYS
jgi:hypothetical protein